VTERWISELTTKKLRRGGHRSTPAPHQDIRASSEPWRGDPKPYVWTKTADQILESIKRYCTPINALGHQQRELTPRELAQVWELSVA
jgi:hypothetical protein